MSNLIILILTKEIRKRVLDEKEDERHDSHESDGENNTIRYHNDYIDYLANDDEKDNVDLKT